MDSGKSSMEDLHAFKNSAEQTEELVDDSEKLLQELENLKSSDKEQRIYDKFQETF